MELLDELTVHFDNFPYFLGYRPCIGDFSFHGSIYAHLLRDPLPGKITKSNAPMVASWCEKMAGHVHESKFFDFWDVVDDELVKRESPDPNYVENDNIPETLFPILQRICREMEPNMKSAIEQIETFAQENGPGQLPKPLTKVISTSIRTVKLKS